jgi:hypothetical protein
MVDQPSLFDMTNKNLPDEEMPPLEPILIDKDYTKIKIIDLFPKNAQLALNRTYSQKAIHLGRILKFVKGKEELDEVVTRDDIIRELSMGKEYGTGTINTMRKAHLLYANSRITPLGTLIINYAPFFDNLGLLWLLHYLLASNAVLVLWSNLFNIGVQDNSVFSIHEIMELYTGLVGRWSDKSINVKARKEIGGILSNYSDDFLREIKLIQKIEFGKYQAIFDMGNIPNLIWLSIMLIYRDRYYPGATTMEIPLVVNAHYSPGRILLQNEAIVRDALEELHNEGLLTIETRSGLDQIRFKRDINWFSAIKAYFGEL